MKTILSLLTCIVALAFTSLQAQHNPISGYQIPTLTPIPQSVAGVANPVILLNGEWDFCKKEDIHNPQKIKVPGEWEMQGFTINDGETAVYSRQLEIPSDWLGKQIKIRFDAISSYALVKINGKIAGEHEGSFVPFEVDITADITKSNNHLEIEVQALTISDRLACTSQYACHTVGGILRKVTLFASAPVHILSNSTITEFDAVYKNARLKVNSVVTKLSPESARIKLLYSLADASGKIVTEKILSTNPKNPGSVSEMYEANLPVKSPEHWNPEHPYLYTLTTSVLANGKILESIAQKVGFRQIVIQGNQVLVNGSPIKLHGVNRHSVYPLTGRSIATDLDRKDAQLFRDANCNYIRTSHYPPSEEFLNAADELGLFVESEASLCWIQHGASPIWQLWNYTDTKYLPFMVRANMDNVVAGRNHPSVIIWSLGNESRWSPLWETVLSVVKQLDPTRPTSFHDQCWGGYNNAQSKADIANYHYPGINGPRAADTASRPTLFGEYAHLSTYNRRELLTDPGVRSAYSAPLVMFYDSIQHYKGNLGGAIWSGVDDIFHLPDGRIVGYGPWGPIDGWRRPKPEYWGMKKAYSPIHISKVIMPVAREGYLELTIENRYDFTSLKDVKILADINEGSWIINSSIPPHGLGTIKIPCQDDSTLVLISFIDPRGFKADEERFVIKKNAIPAPQKQVNLSFTENNSSILVKQGDARFNISKTTGIITNASKGDFPLISRGPVLCIVPMNSDNGGKPNVAGETYQNNIVPLKNYPLYTLFATGLQVLQSQSGISLSMEVTYTNAKGKQTYLFTPDGKLITDYEVQYNGEDSIPYQYGLLVELPKYMDKLSWKRNGEFTTYPANDIARNEGIALLNAKHVNGVEEHGIVPKGDWKDDSNDLGSNDFRSTKRFITEAVLADKSGNQVKTLSDGRQHSRTWLQDEHINWLIADYTNAGSEPFYGSPHSDGRIRIKNKTLKGKLVLVIQ